MYCEQLRSGGFQKEMEEVNMTLAEFKEHFLKCTKKYLEHHFHDVLSSQARRNLYEKLKTDTTLATTIILASDYLAILHGHSQDQLNQTTQLHSIQLVILLSYACAGVLMTTAYSFWHQQGSSKLKSDNHYYRQSKDRVIDDVRARSVPFDRVVEITDGKTHEIDQHIRILVTDQPQALPGDTNNTSVIITNKAAKNYEFSNIPGIQSAYNAIVFKNDMETGEVNDNQTVCLRDAFCSYDCCRAAVTPDDFRKCR
jgi:hypothetical protein